MDKTEFFALLEQEMIDNNIQGSIVRDSYSGEVYAAFGKEKIGSPRVFLDKEESVGAIDVYALEFYESAEVDCINEQKELAVFLKQFLINLYIKEEYGYVIFKRSKKKREPSTSLNDYFFNEFSVNHKRISVSSIIFPFIDMTYTEWAMQSANEKNDSEFSKLDFIRKTLLELAIFDKKLELRDFYLINQEHLLNSLTFKYESTQYFISFPDIRREEDNWFRLEYSDNSKFLPIKFKFNKFNPLVLMENLYETNRLKVLFDDNE